MEQPVPDLLRAWSPCSLPGQGMSPRRAGMAGAPGCQDLQDSEFPVAYKTPCALRTRLCLALCRRPSRRRGGNQRQRARLKCSSRVGLHLELLLCLELMLSLYSARTAKQKQEGVRRHGGPRLPTLQIDFSESPPITKACATTPDHQVVTES